MKKISRRSFLKASGLMAATAALGTNLTACGSSTSSSTSNNGAASSGKAEHAALTICTPLRNVNAFMDTVHEKYPEINFEVIPYTGYNGTAYMQDQLKSGEIPDIYSASTYSPGQMDLSDKLLDLSAYDFTNNYVPSRLQDVIDNGAIYLLPSYYGCVGITYNRNILADNGWTLPTSLKEMEELAPKVREAGYTFFLNQLQYPGYGFQYLCNILDTGFLSTMDGRQWQNDFLAGKTTVRDTPEMMEDMQSLQRWRDIGILNGDMGTAKDSEVAEEMAKGNTLFMMGSSNDFTRYGADSADFGLMPYLSEDGHQNVFILNVTRFCGLSKKLAEPGNEQKLEDALHVMEVMSTMEGIDALNAGYNNTYLAPFKDAPVSEGGYYSDILDQINAGYTAPFIYAGWDNAIVPYGNEMISFIRGEADLDDLIDCMDENQHLITENDVVSYTTVTETIDTEGCAKLTGIAFAKATGSDMALLHLNEWKADVNDDNMNRNGVNGCLFPLPVSEQEIVSFLPTGWRNNIELLTLTGKRIKELAETGYDLYGNGNCYPYLLVTPEGFEVKDDVTYTVATFSPTDEVAAEGDMQDSGILGLTAVKDYLSQFDTLSPEDIVWEKA